MHYVSFLRRSSILSALALSAIVAFPAMTQSQEEKAYFFRHQIPGVIASDSQLGIPGDDEDGEEEVAGPTNCDNIGDTCDDGTIYAGLSPDGDVPMYTTPADAPIRMSWNNGTTASITTSMANCMNASPGTAATCRTGRANTDFLVGLSDAASPYAAAVYCDNLLAHGHDDWYLPAQDELNVLYIHKNTGDLDGTFNSYSTGEYWSSSEYFSNNARYQRFNNGSQSGHHKSTALAVRCVRR